SGARMALAAVESAARMAVRLFLDALLPPQCLACGTVVDDPGNLCAACFGRFTFIARPHCECCGVPLETPVIDDILCGACLTDRPAFARARAVFVYNADSKNVVLKFKHADRTDAAVHLARWMERAGSELVATCNVIAPVPLHRWRFLMRSYN